jgi:hypothetical protein
MTPPRGRELEKLLLLLGRQQVTPHFDRQLVPAPTKIEP